MADQFWLAEQFEKNREHLRAVATRMLGSKAEADDAVQEAWLRLSRSEADSIENFRAWLTTVVSRVCLDVLRSRSAHREESMDEELPAALPSLTASSQPERELILADSVGIALQLVLDRLGPSERIALVLHDMFGMDFEEIANVLGKTPVAARQLASRARRRVRGIEPEPPSDRRRHREVVEQFLDALRAGDFERLVAVLDPNLVFHADRFSAAAGKEVEIHGAEQWARGAMAFRAAVRDADVALVDGEVAVVLARDGHLGRVLLFTFAGDKIKTGDVIGDPARLEKFTLSLLD